jgi:hypothetical protein
MRNQPKAVRLEVAPFPVDLFSRMFRFGKAGETEADPETPERQVEPATDGTFQALMGNRGLKTAA